MVDLTFRTRSGRSNLTAREHIAAANELVQEAQSRLHRIIEMARVVRAEADFLPADCEPHRVRVCAEVIQEAAEMAQGDVERIEIGFGAIRASLTLEGV